MKLTVTVTLEIDVELVEDHWGSGWSIPERSAEEIRVIEDAASRELDRMRTEAMEDAR